jgi:hypothetical protein
MNHFLVLCTFLIFHINVSVYLCASLWVKLSEDLNEYTSTFNKFPYRCSAIIDFWHVTCLFSFVSTLTGNWSKDSISRNNFGFSLFSIHSMTMKYINCFGMSEYCWNHMNLFMRNNQNNKWPKIIQILLSCWNKSL